MFVFQSNLLENYWSTGSFLLHSSSATAGTISDATSCPQAGNRDKRHNRVADQLRLVTWGVRPQDCIGANGTREHAPKAQAGGSPPSFLDRI